MFDNSLSDFYSNNFFLNCKQLIICDNTQNKLYSVIDSFKIITILLRINDINHSKKGEPNNNK